MTKAEMFERIILRGIEGLISDKHLELAVITGNYLAINDSKYIAHQVYAQLIGFGL